MITKEQALTLNYRDEVHFDDWKNSRGECQHARVNGQIKTWKRDESRFYVPLKYGMGYRSQSGYYISETSNGYHLPRECPLRI